MASIDTTTINLTTNDTVQALEQPAAKIQPKPAKSGKGRASAAGIAAASQLKARRPTIAEDDNRTPRQKKATRPRETKAGIVLKKLRSVKGATIAQLGETTGWQAHSVRGFLSAVVRKRLGLPLVSETGKDGVRRYRIAEGAGQAG